MSCRQVECLDGHTKIVPFTYHLGDDIEIQFRREEFCLVTGLRFGVDFSLLYLKGPISFRRRVFDSTMDGNHITVGMLEENIKSKEFYTMNDHDVVGLCLLAILELVLLGQEARHNVPDWSLRLVNDRKAWDMYPWGSYVWPTLYSQLRNADVKWWDVFYGTPVEEDGHLPKYSLTGFTWAFKSKTDPDAFEVRADWAFHRVVQQCSRRRQATPSLKAPKQPRQSIYEFATVSPKKHADKSRNKARNANVTAFDLGKAVVDDDAIDDEVMITGARGTDDYICYMNVDPNKYVKRFLKDYEVKKKQGLKKSRWIEVGKNKLMMSYSGLGSTSGIRAFALRNFDLKVVEFESAQSNTTAKLPGV
ncbi:phospholipase-like protein [Tanacetum coccineum]